VKGLRAFRSLHSIALAHTVGNPFAEGGWPVEARVRLTQILQKPESPRQWRLSLCHLFC
jgi:hypothetical protein